MKIKEARIKAGLSQARMSLELGIPKRTIEDWETERRTIPAWTETLVVEKLNSLNIPTFKIHNSNVLNYVNACKKFSSETSEWGGLDEFTFYTTDGTDWKETSDNAHNGIDLSWSFHLSDAEIEQRAAEELFEKLLQEIDLADSEEWDSDCFKSIYEKFNL